MTIGERPTIKAEQRERPDPEYSLFQGELQVGYAVNGTCYSNFGHRVNPETMKRMREIDQMTDTQGALEAIIDLCQNYTRWEAMDKSIYANGKLTIVPEPETLNWNRCSDDDVQFPGRFKQEVYVGGKNISEGSTFSKPNLRKDIIRAIQAEPILITTKTGKYIFLYEEREHDPSYAVTGHIIFRKVRELK